jgi:hypothetical protein
MYPTVRTLMRSWRFVIAQGMDWTNSQGSIASQHTWRRAVLKPFVRQALRSPKRLIHDGAASAASRFERARSVLHSRDLHGPQHKKRPACNVRRIPLQCGASSLPLVSAGLGEEASSRLAARRVPEPKSRAS